MKQLFISAAMLCLVYCPNLSAADNSTCRNYSNEIDLNTREIAKARNVSFEGRVAAEFTNRLLREGNSIMRNSMTIQLMIQSKCQLPKIADYSVLYKTDAVKCDLALIKSTSPNPPDECDSYKWTDQRDKAY